MSITKLTRGDYTALAQNFEFPDILVTSLIHGTPGNFTLDIHTYPSDTSFEWSYETIADAALDLGAWVADLGQS